MAFERVVVLIYTSVALEFAAGVAQLGQRRWDEVPVRNGSQVRILPSAPLIDLLLIKCSRLAFWTIV